MPANIGESMRFLSARNVEIDVNWCFIEGKKKRPIDTRDG